MIIIHTIWGVNMKKLTIAVFLANLFVNVAFADIIWICPTDGPCEAVIIVK